MSTDKPLIASYFSFFRLIATATAMKLKNSFILTIKPLSSTLNITFKQLQTKKEEKIKR